MCHLRTHGLCWAYTLPTSEMWQATGRPGHRVPAAVTESALCTLGDCVLCGWWPPQAFSSWVHITAIRVFVESILRYGLPPAYQVGVVKVAHTQCLSVVLEHGSICSLCQMGPEWGQMRVERGRTGTWVSGCTAF